MLKADDVVKIINACKENGVVHLKFEKLTVDFVAKESAIKIIPPPSTEIQESKAIEIEESALTDEEIDSKQETLDELHIEDPLAYEELLSRGELTNEGIQTFRTE